MLCSPVSITRPDMVRLKYFVFFFIVTNCVLGRVRATYLTLASSALSEEGFISDSIRITLSNSLPFALWIVETVSIGASPKNSLGILLEIVRAVISF